MDISINHPPSHPPCYNGTKTVHSAVPSLPPDVEPGHVHQTEEMTTCGFIWLIVKLIAYVLIGLPRKYCHTAIYVCMSCLLGVY